MNNKSIPVNLPADLIEAIQSVADLAGIENFEPSVIVQQILQSWIEQSFSEPEVYRCYFCGKSSEDVWTMHNPTLQTSIDACRDCGRFMINSAKVRGDHFKNMRCAGIEPADSESVQQAAKAKQLEAVKAMLERLL